MSKYIKNAGATKHAGYYIEKIQSALVAHGAVAEVWKQELLTKAGKI